MIRLRPLAVIAALIGLTACTTAASGPPADETAAAPPPAAEPAPPADTSAYGLFLAGQAALNHGQGDLAAGYFSQASRTDADSTFIKGRAFRAALAAGDIPRAAALAPGPNEGTAAEQLIGRFTVAVEAIAEGKGRAAELELAGQPLPPPLDSSARLILPWAAAEAGDWKTALATPAFGDDRVLAQVAQLDEALIDENRRDIDKADGVFKSLVADSHGASVYAVAYGEFLQRHGRTALAIAQYQEVLKAEPTSELVKMALARAQAGAPPPRAPTPAQGAAGALIVPAAVLLSEKQPQLGEDFLRLVLRLDPKRDEAWLLLGDAASALGDTDGARAAYAEPQPGSLVYIGSRTRLIASYDDIAGSAPTELALAEETAKGAPDDPEAMELLADALRANERYKDSAAVLDKLIAQLGEKAAWSLYYERGVALDQAGDWAGAERDLQHALTLSPDQPEVLNYLGYSWIDRGVQLKAAKAMVEKAVAAKPDDGAIVDSLGWAYYQMGDYKQAVEQLERATELEPADPDINNHLGDAYWRAGRKLEARFQWQQVLTLGPSEKLRAEVEAKLRDGLGGPARAAVAER